MHERPLISSLRPPKPNIAYSRENATFLSPQPPRAIGGVPHWILRGVFVPWVAFFLIHCWYSLVFMRDDSASERQGPPSAE